MSGLIGKAMKFAKSPQGKKALDKAQKYVKSEQGKEKIEELKGKVGKHEEPKPKPAPVAGTPAPSAEPVDTAGEVKPDPNAPTP